MSQEASLHRIDRRGGWPHYVRLAHACIGHPQHAAPLCQGRAGHEQGGPAGGRNGLETDKTCSSVLAETHSEAMSPTVRARTCRSYKTIRST